MSEFKIASSLIWNLINYGYVSDDDCNIKNKAGSSRINRPTNDVLPILSSNVETVCLLSNRKPDMKVRNDVDLKDYYRIKDSEKTSG